MDSSTEDLLSSFFVCAVCCAENEKQKAEETKISHFLLTAFLRKIVRIIF
jgi:hypothetical protein